MKKAEFEMKWRLRADVAQLAVEEKDTAQIPTLERWLVPHRGGGGYTQKCWGYRMDVFDAIEQLKAL